MVPNSAFEADVDTMESGGTFEGVFDDSDTDSSFSFDGEFHSESSHLLTNWNLDDVLIGGAETSQEAELAPTSWWTGLRETTVTVSWLFTPLLFLIVSLFFLSTSQSTYKLTCSWPLWLYYLLVGVSLLGMCATACIFVLIFKLRDISKPILHIHQEDLSSLFTGVESDSDGYVQFGHFQELLAKLIKMNQNARVSPAHAHNYFKDFEQFKEGGRVPLISIQSRVARLSKFSTAHKIMHVSSVANLALLLVSLAYGSAYALTKHKHHCDIGLVNNLETSLLGLWTVFGVLLTSICLYFTSIFATRVKDREIIEPDVPILVTK